MDSNDTLLVDQTGYSHEARKKAEALVKSFESYLAEYKDEIDALQFFYSVPHKKRLRFKDIQHSPQKFHRLRAHGQRRSCGVPTKPWRSPRCAERRRSVS